MRNKVISVNRKNVLKNNQQITQGNFVIVGCLLLLVVIDLNQTIQRGIFNGLENFYENELIVIEIGFEQEFIKEDDVLSLKVPIELEYGNKLGSICVELFRYSG